MTADFDHKYLEQSRRALWVRISRVLWWPATLVEYSRARFAPETQEVDGIDKSTLKPSTSSGDPSRDLLSETAVMPGINPYQSPGTSGKARGLPAAESDIAVGNTNFFQQLSLSQRAMLFVSAFFAVLSLYLFARAGWFVYMLGPYLEYMAFMGEQVSFGLWLRVYYATMAGLEASYCAWLSYRIWRYAQNIQCVAAGSLAAKPIALDHRKLWSVVAIGVVLYLSSALLDWLCQVALRGWRF